MKCETAFLQNKAELSEFIQILQREGVRSYLEIGSKFGGSLFHIGSALPTGSNIVTVDLPQGDTSFKDTLPALQECVGELRRIGHHVSLIVGDSTDPDVVQQVRELGPYDACFIDANHTLPFVEKDFENYAPMCRLVAMHDINFNRPGGMAPGKKPIEVPRFWNNVRHAYRHVEIKHDKQDNGIGVLWRSLS